ncbi:MAG: DedA family protein [Longimicrobiales bacterium]
MRDFIIEIVRSTGAWGVGILMLLENVFPPIPSELIMPLGGYLTSQGQLSFWPVVIAGSIGSLLGAGFWYCIGRSLGRERLTAWAERRGAWVAMTPDDIERATDWFDRHGNVSVFFCRLLPFLRTVISIPAGLTGMSLAPFLIYSALGTFAWTAALAWGGRLLGSRFPRIENVIGYVSWAIVLAALAWYIYGVARVKRSRKRGAHSLDEGRTARSVSTR